MFAGKLQDVWDTDKREEIFVVVQRATNATYGWFKDPSNKDAVQQLKVGDPLTVLCKIGHAKGYEEIIFYHSCELVK
jgi:hypothetical protein